MPVAPQAEGHLVNALCPEIVETGINREFFSNDLGKTLSRIPQRVWVRRSRSRLHRFRFVRTRAVT